MEVNNIIIGTAQFGSHYGISNIKGQTKLSEIQKILDYAINKEIFYLDSSLSYFKNNFNFLQFDLKNFNVIDKISPNINLIDTKMLYLKNTILNSLKFYNKSELYGVLIHNYNKDYNITLKQLNKLKQEGLISKIGISLYNISDIYHILNDDINIDIVQCPFNVFDRRINNNKILTDLKSKNIEIHIRSIFLQGLLLMNSNIREDKLKMKFKNIFLWDNFLKNNNIDSFFGCMSFIKSYNFYDKIILGIENYTQLLQIIDNLESKNEKKFNFDILTSDDAELINPSLWK